LYIQALEHDLNNTEQFEYACRSIVERLALAWQAATLLTYGDAKVAKAFIESRLHAPRYAMYGAMPGSIDCDYIIKRAQPKTT
jgi:putative acyl-CoA dehydrogenase